MSTTWYSGPVELISTGKWPFLQRAVYCATCNTRISTQIRYEGECWEWENSSDIRTYCSNCSTYLSIRDSSGILPIREEEY